MGEMADDALDNAFDDYEHYEKYKNASSQVQHDEGLIDETGQLIGQPWSIPAATPKATVIPVVNWEKPSGPGPCPICGCPTVLRTNRKLNINFYGCTEFPACKGNRNL